MTARIVNGKRYQSRSAYARHLLVRSKMTVSEIAKAAKITPQTVSVIKGKLS